MKYKSAITIALLAIAKEQRQYAVDANIARLGIGGVAAERAKRKYDRLQVAADRLKQGVLFDSPDAGK